MAGASGKYRGWFTNSGGKQEDFTGTTSRKKTLEMARRFEDQHREIRLGYRPPPTLADRFRSKCFTDVKDEYISWGETQGGRAGGPWGKTHARNRKSHLKEWQGYLSIKVLSDLSGVQVGVERKIREMQKAGLTNKTIADKKAGLTNKTIANKVESLRALLGWCVDREYLESDPLKRLKSRSVSSRMRHLA